MLPIFRIIPVGGVFLAVAILLLALYPPRGTAPVSPALLAARGPLIDRDEHPELEQFLIMAALDRADAVDRLRVIPETHIPPAPPARTPQAGLSLLMPAPEALSQPQAAPVVAHAPETEALMEANAEAEPKEHAAENSAANGEITSAPIAAPAGKNAPAASPATSAGDKPPPVAVAALPTHQGQNDHSAAIIEENKSARQTDTGEAAVFTLPIALPQGRPLALRKLDQLRAHDARLKPRRQAKPRHKPVRNARHATRNATTQPREIKPPDTANSLDLFTAIFGPPPQAASTRRRAQP